MAASKMQAVKKLDNYNLITIELVWTKNKGIYGYQCKAYVYGDEFTTYLSEGSYSRGCGYDKVSWAVGDALANAFGGEWDYCKMRGLSTVRTIFAKYGFKQIVDLQFEHSNSYVFVFQKKGAQND